MLARLQRFITLTLMGAAILWFLALERAGHPMAGLLGAVAIVLGYAFILGVEFISLYVTHGADPAPKASIVQLFGAWWTEVLTAPLVFCWRQPFRTNAEPDVPACTPGRRGVLLVHGLVCNRAFWNPWLVRLRELNIPAVAISMEPVFASVESYASCIEAGAARLEAATGLPPVIVAHSMGGLAVRSWMREHASVSRVHRIITIGTPHRGTWLARFGRGVGGRQMRLNSPWLEALAASETPGQASRFICFYSHCDNVVFPPSTATLPGADNRHVPGCSHVHLAFVDEVFDQVLRSVQADDPGKPTDQFVAPASTPRRI